MTSTTVNFPELRDRYVTMQLTGDRRAALQFVDDALTAGISAAQVSSHIVAAAQREIGRPNDWDGGTPSARFIGDHVV
jgi:hypothetical protein